MSRIFGRLQVADLAKNIMALVNAVRSLYDELDDKRLNDFLADWPPADCRLQLAAPQGLPVLSWMPVVVAAADKKTANIVNQLAALANQLSWGQTYSEQDFGPEFLERYGWTELIGMRGPIASRRIASGFLLLGPHTEYPRHSHEAEEVYVPLTGPTLWQHKHQPWVCRKPCRPIYHAPRAAHAVRTEAVPLLALYVWRGANLTEKSHIE